MLSLFYDRISIMKNSINACRSRYGGTDASVLGSSRVFRPSARVQDFWSPCEIESQLLRGSSLYCSHFPRFESKRLRLSKHNLSREDFRGGKQSTSVLANRATVMHSVVQSNTESVCTESVEHLYGIVRYLYAFAFRTC